MQREVVILVNGREVWRSQISVGGLNFQPTDQDVLREAWRSALEDGAVTEADWMRCSFQVGPGA